MLRLELRLGTPVVEDRIHTQVTSSNHAAENGSPAEDVSGTASAFASRRRGAWLGAAVFAVALAVRLLYLADSADNPSFHAPVIDAATYDDLAREPFDDQGRLKEVFFDQSCFYPFFLAGVYRVTGGSIVAAKLVQVLLGSVTCLLVFRLGRQWVGTAGGLAAGLAAAVYGPLVFYDGELLAETWACFWGVALLGVLLEAARRDRIPWFALAGLCGALSIITRPNFLPPFVVLAAGWAGVSLWRNRDPQRVMARLGAGALGFCLVALPVAWLNARTTGSFSILYGRAGLNLYIGNNPDFCETVTLRPGPAWQRLRSRPHREGFFGRQEEEAYFLREVRDFVRRHPRAFLEGLARKTLQLINSRELPGTLNIYIYREWSRVLRALVWKAGRFGFPFGVLLPLAAVGMLFPPRRIQPGVYLFLALYALPLIAVIVSDRYRLPAVPVLCVFAAGGVLGLAEALRSARPARVAAMVLLMGGVALAATWPDPFCPIQEYKAELFQQAGAYVQKHGDPDTARRYYERALELDPDGVPPHINLGVLEADAGRRAEAREHFEMALARDPEAATAHYDLGCVLLQLGELDEAQAHLRRAIDIQPDYPEAYLNLGLCLESMGWQDAAIRAYRSAVRLRPSSAEAHSNLGVALVRSGRPVEALACFAKARSLAPGREDIVRNHEMLLEQMKAGLR